MVTPGLKESWSEAEACYQTDGSGSLQRGQEVKTGKGTISVAMEMPVCEDNHQKELPR